MGEGSHRRKRSLGAFAAMLVVWIFGATDGLADPFGDPVKYPRIPALIIAEVQIEGEQASMHDTVAAFVGEELRGKAKVIYSKGKAYVALMVNVDGATNTATFKIYDASADAELTAALGGASKVVIVPAGTIGSGDSPVTVTINDTTAPSAPTLTGSSLTNDSTPTWTGVAEASATVTVLNGGVPLGQVAADGSGNYSFMPGTALPDGSHVITATATDGSGNTSAASSSLSVVVDTNAPGVPTISATSPTNDITPTFIGTAEAVTTVTILSDGATLGQATVDGSGNYSFTPSAAFSDGSFTITATAADSAGNTSGASDGLSLVVDTAAPAAPTLTGTTPTKDSTPELSGTAEAASTVTVYDGGTALGQATADAGGLYSFVSGTLSEGGHVITATATDAAGNTSGSSGSLTRSQAAARR